MDDITIFVVFALMIGIFILTLLYLKKSHEKDMKLLLTKMETQTFKELSNFKELFRDDVSGLKEKVNNDLYTFGSHLSMDMRTDFHRLNENTSEHFTRILEQITRLDVTQKNLEGLSEEIASLQRVLLDKKSRGVFGEVELYSLLEQHFGLNGKLYEKQYTLSNGKIADAMIFAPKPLNKIAIDSKFPLENYNRMYDSTLGKAEQEKARNQFRNDVILKIKEIASKYIIASETADFAYMFIPAEGIFLEICSRFDDILALSYEYKVYLVSPTTMMAYLSAMRAIYLGQERNNRIEAIQQEFMKLGKEFVRFDARWEKVVSDFRRTSMDLQDLNITAMKIIQRFKAIEEMEFDSKDATHHEHA